MEGFTYLAALLFSLAGMLVLDWRFRLAFFKEARRTASILAVGVGLFLVWDLFGIGLGIFFVGDSTLTTGIMLGPELPLEELFFLTFLCYFTLIVFRLIESRARS